MSDGLPGDMEVPCDHGFEAACKNEARGRNRYQAEVIRLRAVQQQRPWRRWRQKMKTRSVKMRYAQTLSRLDRDQQGIIPGPMPFVSKGGPMDGKA